VTPDADRNPAPSLPRVERGCSFWAWVNRLGMGHDNHSETFEHVSRMTTLFSRNLRNPLHSLASDDGTQPAIEWLITGRPQ